MLPPGAIIEPAKVTVSPFNARFPPGSTRITDPAPTIVSARTSRLPVNTSFAPFDDKLRLTGVLTPGSLTICDRPGRPWAITSCPAIQLVTTGWITVPAATDMPGIVADPLTRPMPLNENVLKPPLPKNLASSDRTSGPGALP